MRGQCAAMQAAQAQQQQQGTGGEDDRFWQVCGARRRLQECLCKPAVGLMGARDWARGCWPLQQCCCRSHATEPAPAVPLQAVCLLLHQFDGLKASPAWQLCWLCMCQPRCPPASLDRAWLLRHACSGLGEAWTHTQRANMSSPCHAQHAGRLPGAAAGAERWRGSGAHERL